MRGMQLALPVFFGSCLFAFSPGCAPVTPKTAETATAVATEVAIVGSDVACILVHDNLSPLEILKACPQVPRDGATAIGTILSAHRARTLEETLSLRADCARPAK